MDGSLLFEPVKIAADFNRSPIRRWVMRPNKEIGPAYLLSTKWLLIEEPVCFYKLLNITKFTLIIINCNLMDLCFVS